MQGYPNSFLKKPLGFGIKLLFLSELLSFFFVTMSRQKHSRNYVKLDSQICKTENWSFLGHNKLDNRITAINYSKCRVCEEIISPFNKERVIHTRFGHKSIHHRCIIMADLKCRICGEPGSPYGPAFDDIAKIHLTCVKIPKTE